MPYFEGLLNRRGKRMKKRRRLSVAILLIVMTALPALAQDDIGVDGIRAVLKKKDSHGQAWYAVQATVRNSSESVRDVSVILQAVAGRGIELKTAKLRGKIEPNSAKVLKGVINMRSQDYKAIDRWQVKEILIHQ